MDSILAVEAHDGTTAIARVDEVGRSVLRDRLYTIGELLRLNQLQPDLTSVMPSEKAKQLDMFDFKSEKSSQGKDKAERK